MRHVRPHYVGRNEQARVPSRYVILATEQVRTKQGKDEVRSWAKASTISLEWLKTGEMRESACNYATPMELWSAVSDFTRKGRRTVVYAHNLNYDLRISQALSSLPALGWTLADMRIDGRGSWSKWSRDRASLILCDSASIFPVKLQELATLFGLTRLSLKSAGIPGRSYASCERDARIIAVAITVYIEWLRTGQCGNWRMTGASQSWAHWRHSHYTHEVLVHDSQDAIEAERAAMYAGRCEAFAWGKHAKGPYYEYDWQNSYPRIARDTLLPSCLRGTVTAPSASSLASLLGRYCVLAELEVTTKVPCVPSRHNDGILWPVGTFSATLWDPEIRLLQEFGATFRVRRAWLYKREPVLRGWAEWVLSALHDRTDTVEPWKKLILKHWSRALIGRFSMRYRSWEKYAIAKDSNIYISPLHNMDTGQTTELMQIGTDIFTSGDLKEISDGCPQITSYIMSVARAKLWRAVQSVGMDNVLYVDTDSLLVNAAGHKRIQENTSDTLFDGLRTKGRYNEVHLYGPRAILLNGKPTVSGMPKSSAKRHDGTWIGEVWRGGKESIRTGQPHQVTISSRTFTLQYNDKRRYFNGDQTTLAYCLPGYSPVGIIVRPKSHAERLADIDYPAMLAHSTSKKPANRPVKGRHTNHHPMRTMPQ